MTWSEGHFTFLDLTLQTLCLITCSSWCHFRKLWTVGRSDWSTVLIHTLHCDWIWVSNKLFVWCESYSSIWRNCVSSLTWNRFLFASIFESWLNCFINWNQWITTSKRWSTRLWNTLRTCAGCASSCRSDLSHCWCISRSNLCTVLIYTFDCDWSWCTNILFFWSKGDRTIWIDAVFTHTWNCFRWLSIFESHWFRIINWNQWITFCEGWGTFLWLTLDTIWSGVCWSWCYFFHYRLVLDSNRSSVGIHTSQFKLWCFTLELFIRSEGHLTVCIHFELTNIWYFFHSCTIVK